MSDEIDKSKKDPFRTFRRLFTWKVARRILVTVAILLTLAMLYYAEESFRGKRAWEKQRAELEAQGVELDLAAFVPAEVPDDQNFMMTPLLAPLFAIGITQSERAAWQEGDGYKRATGISLTYVGASAPDQTQPCWHVSGRTDLAIWQEHFRGSTNFPSAKAAGSPAEDTLLALTKYDAEIAELRAASRRPFARANLNYDSKNPFAIYLPHCSVTRTFCQILEIRAAALLTLGRSDEALEDLRLMFYLVETADDEPFLVSQLVRIANQRQCLRVIWQGVADRQWSDAHLAELQARLASVDQLAAMERALKSEQAAADKLFALLQAEPELLPHFVDGSEGFWSRGADSGPMGFLFKLVPGGWYPFERKNYHLAFGKFGMTGLPDSGVRIDPRRVESNWKDVEASIVKNPAWKAILGHRVLSAIFMPALDRIPIRFTAAQSHASMAVLACALERHRLATGSHPAELSGLSSKMLERQPMDPLTGEAFKYRLSEGGSFVLYSVGWDLKDDGGEPGIDERNPEKPDFEKGDWIWRSAP